MTGIVVIGVIVVVAFVLEIKGGAAAKARVHDVPDSSTIIVEEIKPNATVSKSTRVSRLRV